MATVLHAADYGRTYAGNFIASLLALDNVLNEELGLRLVLVFSDIVKVRQWLAQDEASWYVHSDWGDTSGIKRWVKDLLKMRLVAARWVNCIVAVSDRVAEQVVRRGAPIQKCFTVYNGIDVDRVAVSRITAHKEVLRRLFNIPERHRVLLMFGWSP